MWKKLELLLDMIHDIIVKGKVNVFKTVLFFQRYMDARLARISEKDFWAPDWDRTHNFLLRRWDASAIEPPRLIWQAKV